MTIDERTELDKLLDMYYSDNYDSSKLALYMIQSNYSHLVLMWYMDGNGYCEGNGNGNGYGNGYGYGDGSGYNNGNGDTPQVLTIIRRMEAA